MLGFVFEHREVSLLEGLIFDAMTTDRPYQKGMSKEVALTKLPKEAGKKIQGDEILDALVATVNGKEE